MDYNFMAGFGIVFTNLKMTEDAFKIVIVYPNIC